MINFLEIIIISVISSTLCLFLSYKYLQVLQQCGYTGSAYYKWSNKKNNVYRLRRFLLVTLSTLSYFIVTVSLLFVKNSWALYVGFLPYLVFCGLYVQKDKKLKKKIPLRLTRRMIRLVIAYFLILFVICFGLLALSCTIFNNFDGYAFSRLKLFVVCLMPLFIKLGVFLAHFIVLPLEKRINGNYIKKCKKKLNGYKNLIRIGITGSYGKTSTKNILTTLLSQKYKVLCTPKSFNTPLGISKAVKYLDDSYDIFIAEMGARHVGDIKELAEIVCPDYAVINGITSQHLETFGSLDIIKKTKYELVEYMKKGAVAFSLDSEPSYELYKKCPLDKIGAGIDGKHKPYVYADNIEYSCKGSKFTLHIGERKLDCSTKLIGGGNISNICLAVALCTKFSLTDEEIKSGINSLETVEHRLQVYDDERDITVIDDSYNSSIVGSQNALETLKLFGGKKVVITPGLVELGMFQEKENYEFGKRIGKVADYVILVGRLDVYKIRDGLIDGGFNSDNVFIVKDIAEAVSKLNSLKTEPITVLFENDLPDKFA